MELTEKEQIQVEKGLEIAFMHLKEIIAHPEKLDGYLPEMDFFPVYLKGEGKDVILPGVKPDPVSV